MIADPKSAAITVGLVVSFAALVTAHVACLYGLVRHRKLLGASVGLIIPLVAPIWAWRNKMHVRCIIWVIFAAAYVTFYMLAR